MKLIVIQKVNMKYTSLQLQKRVFEFFFELNKRGIQIAHFMTVETVEELPTYENFIRAQNNAGNSVDFNILFVDFEGESLEWLLSLNNLCNTNRFFMNSSELKEKVDFLFTTIQNRFSQRDGMVFSRVVKLCGIKNNDLQKGMQQLLRQEKIVSLSVDCLEIKKQPTVCLGSLEEEQFGEVLDVTLYLQETMGKDENVTDSMLMAQFSGKIYATEDELTLESVLIEKMKSKRLTLSAAESCTGGLFMAHMINVSGASSVIDRSFITYANEAKEECLCVSSHTLEKFGAVSKETAREMAIGAAKAANSDVAISITGIAGPLGGTKEKPVGTVYLGCFYKGDTHVILFSGNGTREEIRTQTVQMAKNLLFQVLNLN